MSGGGGKGGSQTTSVEIPAWLRDPSVRAIARGEDIARIGYVPYSGPDVAAFTGAQNAAFSNTNDAASAFGMQGGGMPSLQATDYGNGVQGYSSMPIYQGAMDEFAQSRPGQFGAINDFFIDPMTGRPSQGQVGQGQQGQGQYQPMYAQEDDGGSYNDPIDFRGGSGGGFNLGGYSGLGDMVNGGGPGASGSQFQGGGMVSNIGNAVTSPRDGSGGGFGGGK